MSSIINRTVEEKETSLAICYEAWRILVKKLTERGYVHVSFNKDNNSEYLVLRGAEDEVTSWFGKPELSFRFAENWSWYANTNKNPEPTFIQCHNTDLNFPHPREDVGKGSSPVKGWAIGFYRNGIYHTVVGSFFDFTTGRWEIKNPKITDALIDRLFDDRRFH